MPDHFMETTNLRIGELETKVDLIDKKVVCLTHANEPPSLFLMGDAPVRVEAHPEDGHPVVRPLTVDRVIRELAEAIEWIRPAKNGQPHATPPPVVVARNILAWPELPFATLDRIVEVPVFGRDGQLRREAGYHHDARILYQPPEDLMLPAVPSNPTDSDIADGA